MSQQMKHAYPVQPFQVEHLSLTISSAKQLLIENKKFSHTKGFFWKNQLKNISPIFWLIQFICFVYGLWQMTGSHDIESIRMLFAVLVPVLALYILPELYKTHICNMIELETACPHSPVKLVAVKLMILSVSNFTIVALISLAFGFYHQLNLLTVLAQGLIPLNIAISIFLLFFDFIKITSPYLMFASTITVATALILMQTSTLVNVIFDYWEVTLLTSCLILVILIVFTLHRIKNVKEWYYGT